MKISNKLIALCSIFIFISIQSNDILITAAHNGLISEAQKLSQNPNIDINYQLPQDKFGGLIQGDTALHAVIKNIINDSKKNDKALYKSLLKQRLQIIDALLNNTNINVNLQNKNGKTPLLLAMEICPMEFEIIKKLLRKNADEEIKDNNGSNFFDYLEKNPQVKKLYIEFKKILNATLMRTIDDYLTKLPKELNKTICDYVH